MKVADLEPLAQAGRPSPPHGLSLRPLHKSFQGRRSMIHDLLQLAFGEIMRERHKMPSRGRWCLVRRLSQAQEEEGEGFERLLEEERRRRVHRTETRSNNQRPIRGGTQSLMEEVRTEEALWTNLL